MYKFIIEQIIQKYHKICVIKVESFDSKVLSQQQICSRLCFHFLIPRRDLNTYVYHFFCKSA